MSDYLWIVAQPRNGEADAIARMNTRLLAFDPNTPARSDAECLRIARSIHDEEHPSFADMVRRGMESNEQAHTPAP